MRVCVDTKAGAHTRARQCASTPRRTLRTSQALAAMVTLLRTRVAHLSDDRHIQPDMQAAIHMVKSGALLHCANSLTITPLPGVR